MPEPIPTPDFRTSEENGELKDLVGKTVRAKDSEFARKHHIVGMAGEVISYEHKSIFVKMPNTTGPYKFIKGEYDVVEEA